NQLFLDLYRQRSGQPDAADAFVQALSRPHCGWPADGEFREGVLRYPLFLGSHPDHRRLILEALEDSFPHRVPASYQDLEVMLIVPIMPRPDWLAEIGGGEELHWKLVGTLGNLTWGARGRSVSLRVAERKRELARLTRYSLELSRDLAQVERWTADEIEGRSRRLADRAIAVWPGPRERSE
ncbi:MAG: hypothetical protein KGJ86_16210, partial [Chloroflexota bacterium]|nr:hypothetical protein [Chloroflexota bacterium]